MAHRYTAQTLLDNDEHWDLDKHLGRVKRERNRDLTPEEVAEETERLTEQRKMAEKVASDVRARVEKTLSRANRIQDAVKRAVALDRDMQYAADLYAEAGDARDRAIIDALKQAPPGTGGDLTRHLAHLLFLSPSRVRQVKSRDAIEDPTHVSHGQSVRERLTKEFLEEEYVVKGRSQPDIAKEVGCGPQTVGRAMARFGIEARKGRPKGKASTASS